MGNVISGRLITGRTEGEGPVTAEVLGPRRRVRVGVPLSSPDRAIGWAGPLTVVMAAGLLSVALAFNAARDEIAWAPLAYWLGLILIVAPASARALAPKVRRSERLVLVVALGLALYWVSVLRSPIAFTGHDELLHLRTFLDIGRSGHLFGENPLLLVSPSYPAMESAASAISQISGLDPWSAGVLLIGVMRVVFVLAAFLFFEAVSGSAWLAGAALIVYMANPAFLFFDAQFSYESFALPLAITVLWALTLRQSAERALRLGLTAVALVLIGAIVTGHHVTAIALAAALVVWSATLGFARWRHYTTHPLQGVGGMAAITVVAGLTWALHVATEVLKYLGPLLASTAEGVVRFVLGEASGRALFSGFGATGAPQWERIVAVASTATILIALPVGLAILWLRYRRRPAALLLGLMAVAYPMLLALRLTSFGGLEAASRAGAYVFVGVAFVVALGLVRLVRRLTAHKAVLATPVATGLVTLVFAGGFVLGSAWWSRLPGPFLVGGESRAISPQGMAAAEWMLAELGPANRVAADRSNRLLVGSYGAQRVVFDARDPIGLWPLYSAPSIDAEAARIVRRGDIRYILVDRRLSNALPMVGLYFDQSELLLDRKEPIPAHALGKFDDDVRVDRIYDSGAIRVYDAGRLRDGR